MLVIQRHIYLSFLVLLTACGGGGGSEAGGGDPAGPVYTGKTDAVQIAGDNAAALFAYHAQANDALEVISAFNPDYFYKSVLLTESVLRSDVQASQSVCESGSIDRSGELDAAGRGDVTLSFLNCRAEGAQYNGEVRFVAEDRGMYRHNTLYFSALSLASLQDSQVGFTFHGELAMPRLLNGSAANGDEVLTGQLLLVLAKDQRQISLSNISKSYRIGNDYVLTAQIDVSHLGRASFELDSINSSVRITSGAGRLDVAIDTDNDGRTLAHQITMHSDQAGSAEQSIRMSVNELANYLFSTKDDVSIVIRGESQVGQGETVGVQASFPQQSSAFFVYDWRVENFSGDCELSDPRSDGAHFRYEAGCAGELVLQLQVRNDQQSSNTASFRQIVLQNAAEFTYTGVPARLSAGDNLSLAPTIDNPNQGPFGFSLSYGAGGGSVSADGSFQWDSSQLMPTIGQSVILNYGVTATNDRSSTEVLSFVFDKTNYVLPTTIDDLPFSGFHIGGVDLNPSDPSASIAFLYDFPNQPVKVVKLNKSSLLRSEIANDLPQSQSLANSNLRGLSINDYTGDGTDDAAYIVQRSFGGLSYSEVKLFVYDYVSESIAMQPVLLNARTSSISFDILDMQFVDIDGDLNKEILFYIDGKLTNHDSGDIYQNSVMAYYPGSGELKVVRSGEDESGNVARTAAVKVFAANNTEASRMLVVEPEFVVSYTFNGQSFIEDGRVAVSKLGTNRFSSLNHIRRLDVDGDGADEYVILTEGDRFSCTDSDRDDAKLLILSDKLGIEMERDLNMNVSSISTGIYGDSDTGLMLQRYRCDGHLFAEKSFLYLDSASGAIAWEGNFDPVDPNRYAGMTSHNGVLSFRDASDKLRFVAADAGLRISN